MLYAQWIVKCAMDVSALVGADDLAFVSRTSKQVNERLNREVKG